MSRRIYYWNPKRKQIHQEALLNLRNARQSIDPELLESARQAIAEGMEKARSQQDIPANEKAPPGTVPVDRQKNLSVIMQFLELKRDNQQLLGKVKGLMLDV
ncbi:MAG: hypothetical protein KJ667_06690 [Alphaproteobacteria bacterium]|nr:hypothetical protein [Alphaproteobacteria bacterium]